MDILVSLISIFCVSILGAACYRNKLFNRAQIDGFEQFLFKIMVPAYLFIATYKRDLDSLLNTQYIISYLGTFFVLSVLVALTFARKKPAASMCMQVLASGYVNAAMYTLPIMIFLLEDPTAAIIGNILQVVIIQPIFIAILNLVQHEKGVLRNRILAFLKTPIIIAPMLGILLNYLRVPIPDVVIHEISLLGDGAPGVALFTFGLTLGAIKLTRKHITADLLKTVFAKNILHPAVAACVACFMKLDGYWFDALIIASAAPTAFIPYLLAKQFSVEEELIKNAIGLSSIISIVSLIFIANMII